MPCPTCSNLQKVPRKVWDDGPPSPLGICTTAQRVIRWFDCPDCVGKLTESQKYILRTIPRDGPRYLVPYENEDAEVLRRMNLLWTDRTSEPSHTGFGLMLARLTYEGLRVVTRGI